MTVRRFGFFLVCACALFALASCGNDAVSSSDAVPEGMARITLVVNGARATGARDIYPHIDESQLTDLILKGKRNNESETEIAQAATLEELQSQTIDIATGYWTFTLEATLGGAPYSGTTGDAGITVERNKENVVSFTLAADTTQSGTVYGGFSLELAFTGSATKVTGEVLSLDGTTTVCETEPLTITDGTVTYAKSATDENERIAAGTYRVVIVFYGGTNGDVLVNRYQEYVHIAGGVTTTAERRTIDLNEVYTITYDDNGGELGAGQSKPVQFSRRQEVTLPLAVRDGYIFAGWQRSAGEPAILTLPKNTVGNVTLTAQWIAPLLYVAQDGTTVGKADGGTLSDGLTEAAALNTLQHGISQINSIADAYADCNTIAGQNRAATQDWTVQLSGHLAPASITGLSASSLVLKGKTGSSDDLLEGTGTGTVLTITDNIAVTVQDIGVAQGLRGIVQSGNGALTITGSWIGNNGADSSNEQGGGIALLGNGITLIDRSLISGNKAKDGAGIYVARGTLTITDSTISGNTATGNGGGIGTAANASTICIYGSAVIGGMSPEDANVAMKNGGGLYTTSCKLYLGYSAPDTVSSWTGGIYGNTANYDGGGIDFPGNGGGLFRMAGGTISGNKTTLSGLTTGRGGGIYLSGAGNHEITGGTISGNNTAKDGGGVYVAGGTLKMSGGEISGNTADGDGDGVYLRANTFSMSDKALVASDNAVYLATGMTITVGDTLTASAPVATITLPAAQYVPETQVLGGSADLLASEHGKFSVAPDTNGNAWAIDSEGKLRDKITLSASDSASITDPSVPYVITGADGQNNKQIDINTGGTVTEDATYYITLDHVTRTAGEWASGMFIYNTNPGTTLTVYITLVGENSIIAGKSHGGLQVKAVSGATVNVIFMTTTGGSLFLDSQAKTDIAKESDGTVTFSVASGSYFSGTSGGSNYTDATAFFTAAQSSTSGSTISLSDTPFYTGGITITVPTYTSDDLELTATSDGTAYTFTAKSGYASYAWAIDDSAETTTTSTYTKSLDALSEGSHTLLLIATDASGKAHNATIIVTVN